MSKTDQAQFELQNLLRKNFADAKVRNPSYTMRSFARRLKVSSGALSEILAGRRRVGKKWAIRAADELALDPSERARLIEFFAVQEKSSSATSISKPTSKSVA